jgi:predicted small lipoprotein YifL
MTSPRLHRGVRAVLVLAAVAGATLAGCGQKGPLYLPGESPQPVEPGIPVEEVGRGIPEEEKRQDEEAAGER